MKPQQTCPDTELWSRIESYDFDFPISAYNFSTRLASENNWTVYFTHKAITEYRKFMYLAATADVMISPSETVDKVWHLHLIFTKSYADFGSLLGKTVHHIPSTRATDEHQKFIHAKENMRRLYNETFGEMPPDIWLYDDMYGPLNWDPPKESLTLFVIAGSAIAILLLFPLYAVLQPLYIHLSNPYFLIGYIGLIIITCLFLYRYSISCLGKIITNIKDGSFLQHLQPAEVIYLKNGLAAVIHNSINNMVESGRLAVTPDGTLQVINTGDTITAEEFSIRGAIQETGDTHYRAVIKQIASKAIFTNTLHAMKTLRERFRRSNVFSRLFRINFIVLVAVFMPGVIRLITGIGRNKPVDFLLMTLVLFFFLIIGFLRRLSVFFYTQTIPGWYKYHLLPNNPQINQYEWLYFLSGTSALSASMVPLVASFERSHTSSTGDGGSSCGSGCGGGGCGGGGCGGCGGD